jgi:hypothetical protein
MYYNWNIIIDVSRRDFAKMLIMESFFCNEILKYYQTQGASLPFMVWIKQMPEIIIDCFSKKIIR